MGVTGDDLVSNIYGNVTIMMMAMTIIGHSTCVVLQLLLFLIIIICVLLL